MQTQNEGDFLALLQVARIVEEVGAAGLHLYYVSLVYDSGSSALAIGTVQVRNGRAGRAGEPKRLFLGARHSRNNGYDADDGEQSDQT